MENSDLQKRARAIKLLGCDVDGVLTDGRLYIGESGEVMKAFCARDGYGLKIARKQGLVVALISGRDSEMVNFRARELKIEEVHLGIKDKVSRMEELLKRHNLDYSQAAYIGDDLIDLGVLEKVGLACTVPEGASELKRYTHYITGAQGGKGAVREVVELILKIQGRWPY